jgi:hypothetical protein
LEDLDLSIVGLDDDDEPCKIPVPQGVPAKLNTTSLSLENIEMLPAELGSLDEIRNIWLSARSPSEVSVQARTMPFGVWMDYAIKLSPKNVNVKGQFDIRAAFATLGPVRRSK